VGAARGPTLLRMTLRWRRRDRSAGRAAADAGAVAAVGRVGVVGLGLVGGSLARALAAAGADVAATDAARSAREQARAAGLTVHDDVATLCAAAPDLVVLAVPLRAMRAVAVDLARHLGPDTTLTDVGSVKGPVRRAVEAAGIDKRYVGAHPMAGTEHSGFLASDAGLLVGAPWAVTVTPDTDVEGLLRVLRLVTGVLGGTAAVVTDDLHDEAVALVSHVPHVLATQLLNAVAGAPVRDLALGLAAGSFRDGTRVARTDPGRTEAMVVDNAAWVAPALRKAVRDLEALVQALEANAPTTDFFHLADDVRATTGAERPIAGGAVERMTLAGDWAERLVRRCAAGAVVVGVDGPDLLLAAS
jgi:prephenate dehydrogenase